MILKIGSVENAATPTVQEVEAEQTDSVDMVTQKAAKAFGYHGAFSVRLPSGTIPRRRANLEDVEEFMGLSGDEVLPLVQVGTEG